MSGANSTLISGDFLGMRVSLWRAAGEQAPWVGYRSFWTPDRDHVNLYRTMPGFGGPAVYGIEVELGDSDLLDLRHSPWDALGELFHLEREDYGAGEPDYEIFQALASMFKASGYRWIAFYDGGHREAEHWMCLGDAELPVFRV